MRAFSVRVIGRNLAILSIVLLLSGCAAAQKKPVRNDAGAVRVSGDITIIAGERNGF